MISGNLGSKVCAPQPRPTKTPATCARRLHGFDRAVELARAIAQGTPRVVKRGGRVTGYTTHLGFIGHSTAETNLDMQALLASAESFAGPGILVPSRNSVLLRWCLQNGLRVEQPMTLLSAGLYNDPAGANLHASTNTFRPPTVDYVNSNDTQVSLGGTASDPVPLFAFPIYWASNIELTETNSANLYVGGYLRGTCYPHHELRVGLTDVASWQPTYENNIAHITFCLGGGADFQLNIQSNIPLLPPPINLL